MSGLAVQVESVGKRFHTPAGVVAAVDAVNLEVRPGGSLAIEGRSGSGKSTLLAMIGALERPTTGRVRLGERTVSSMSRRDRARVRRENIGFVFQNDDLQPFLTAMENVAVSLALTGQHDQYERAQGLLESLGLGEFAARLPDEMSGGERQRVAVARALVHEPRLVLADEPTGALDAGNARTVTDLLLAAGARTGATVVAITHDPLVASRFDERAVLRDGSMVHDMVRPGGSS